MTKKKYIFIISVALVFMILGFSTLATAAILQDSEDVPRWLVNTFGFSFFPLMTLGIIILMKNFSRLTEFELSKNYEKLDRKSEKWKFDSIRLNLTRDTITSRLGNLKFNKRITNDAILYKKSIQLIDS